MSCQAFQMQIRAGLLVFGTDVFERKYWKASHIKGKFQGKVHRMLQNTHDQSQTFLQYMAFNGDGTLWPFFWFGPACAAMFIVTISYQSCSCFANFLTRLHPNSQPEN
ncbi:uncharacterized protein LOC111451392 isoform X2 [Cucurbita moschata]|uniref:Uncharacterized protein LOC111451392 isoform X2 n=1 Tax=Cucurbita moschata TaxID=3662 RepID=A0A6J1G6Y9_CUCMO|nr:uncharacterized protein LOC111451392 isoform X2 [Cucurbita moschata]